MKKFKFILIFILIFGAIAGKYIVFDYPVSRGKRAGNLTKISKKGKFIKTWEGTIDEGSGDKLTSYFSVKNEKLGKELFELKQRKVVIYYEEYISGWPRDTKYNVVSWEPLREAGAGSSYNSYGGSNSSSSNEMGTSENNQGILDSVLSRTLFCATLGTLLNEKELYLRVKDYLKNNNKYLYNQMSFCNQTSAFIKDVKEIEEESSSLVAPIEEEVDSGAQEDQVNAPTTTTSTTTSTTTTTLEKK